MFDVTLALESCMIDVWRFEMPHTESCFILNLPVSLSIATLAAGNYTLLLGVNSVCAPC